MNSFPAKSDASPHRLSMTVSVYCNITAHMISSWESDDKYVGYLVEDHYAYPSQWYAVKL